MLAFEKIEQQKADILVRVEGWPIELLGFRPSEGEWSAVEVLDHLVRTEDAIQAAARIGLSKPHRIGLLDKLRTRSLSAVFRSDRRVKVPRRVTQVLPGAGNTVNSVRDSWGLSRASLAQFLVTIPEALLSEGIFKHPVGGWMSVTGILGFLSDHITHHEFQLSRILKVKEESGAHAAR